jgi:7-cyano-7-deazaguanine reductase
VAAWALNRRGIAPGAGAHLDGASGDNAAMTRPEDSLLGRPVEYAGQYAAERLFPIPRRSARDALGLHAPLPFSGIDIWNAYELSWLDPAGKPHVAVAELRVPADSPNLIESKSLKLYLNGFMQTRMRDAAEVAARLTGDLGEAAGAPVIVQLRAPWDLPPVAAFEGDCIDALEVTIDHYGPPDPSVLAAGDAVVEEGLVSHLLKSNCPVTGQPDWASVQIRYRGPQLDRAALLRYLVGYREHAEFHEQCVERIFRDLWQGFAPEHLCVYARYTRRGGVDINPFRSSEPGAIPDNVRLPRQ